MVFQAVFMMTAGDREGADDLFEKILRLWPNHQDTHWYRFVNAAFYGDTDEALKLLTHFPKLIGLDREQIACWRTFISARARGGNPGHRATLPKSCTSMMTDYQARMLAVLGDTEGAYEVTRNQSFDFNGSTVFLFYPEMAQFRRDARFMPFVVDSGLVEYWLASGQWPDFCSDKDQAYDCKEAAARALQERRGASAASSPQPR